MDMRTTADVAADATIVDDAIPDVIEDNPNPTPPAPEPAPQTETPPADTPPAPQPDKPEDARAAAARRIKERRAQERAEFDSAPTPNSESEPPFVKPIAPPAEEPTEPAPAEIPAAPEKLTIKVNGKESQHSRDELARMAGLEPEDAADLPEKSLIKAAQINEAARLKHERAKVQDAPTAREASTDQPAVTKEPQAEPAPRKRRVAIPADVVKNAVEKIAYGDADEATAAFQDAIDAAFEARDTSDAEGRAHSERQEAIETWGKENPDIAQDARASRYFLTNTTAQIIDDLRGLGAPEANLEPLLLNPGMAIEAHKQARQAGMNVRSPAEILAAATDETRGLMGMKKAGETPPPPPVPATPTNTRLEAKRQLTLQPQRSGNPPPPAPPAPPVTRSSTVARMRQARGLPVD